MELSTEVVMFKSLIHNRPVGLSKHFKMLQVIIDMSPFNLTNDQIWQQLGQLYSLDLLDTIAEDVIKPEDFSLE